MFYRSFFFSAFVLFLFVSPSLQAQDSTSLAGKYALQFQISQNFTLSNFLGSVISGKYHFTNESALRVGVDLSTIMNNQSNTSHDNSFVYATNNVNETNSQSISIIAQYLRTVSVGDNIRFYYGIGPKAGIGFAKQNTGSNTTGTNYAYQKQTYKNFSAGFLCSAGAEWFFSKKMSLCAEYGFAYQYIYSKTTSNSNTSSEQTVRNYGYSFRGENVRFGLSVYF